MDELPSWSVCSALQRKVHPYHMPAKQDTNHPNNNGHIKPVEADNEAVYSVASSSAVVPPSCTRIAPISSYGAFPKGTKGRPSGAGLYRRAPCHPLAHLLHLDGFGWDAQLQGLARHQILPMPEVLLFLDHHPSRHQYLLQLGQLEDPISNMVEMVSRLPLGVLSMPVDLNPFKEEISWKREAGGKVRPLKAMVIQVMAMRLPPRPHHLPIQLWAGTIRVPAVGRHGQAGGLPGRATR